MDKHTLKKLLHFFCKHSSGYNHIPIHERWLSEIVGNNEGEIPHD
jgi:hypothetical protein